MSATKKAFDELHAGTHKQNADWQAESINASVLAKVDLLDRQLAEAVRMVAKAHERIDELRALAERVESLETSLAKITERLKVKFFEIEERLK